jgi:hypothetical protein
LDAADLADKHDVTFMRALNLFLAIGVVGLISVPVRTQQGTAVPIRDSHPATPRLLAGTRGTVFATIRGNALSATNAVLPNVPVRLRDARQGHIVTQQRTDKSGLFTFEQIEPGSYVVELTGDRGAVLAASNLINIGANETASTIVQLPARVTTAGMLSSHGISSLLAVLSSASAAGVLATSSTVDVSEDRPRVP